MGKRKMFEHLMIDLELIILHHTYGTSEPQVIFNPKVVKPGLVLFMRKRGFRFMFTVENYDETELIITESLTGEKKLHINTLLDADKVEIMEQSNETKSTSNDTPESSSDKNAIKVSLPKERPMSKTINNILLNKAYGIGPKELAERIYGSKKDSDKVQELKEHYLSNFPDLGRLEDEIRMSIYEPDSLSETVPTHRPKTHMHLHEEIKNTMSKLNEGESVTTTQYSSKESILDNLPKELKDVISVKGTKLLSGDTAQEQPRLRLSDFKPVRLETMLPEILKDSNIELEEYILNTYYNDDMSMLMFTQIVLRRFIPDGKFIDNVYTVDFNQLSDDYKRICCLLKDNTEQVDKDSINVKVSLENAYNSGGPLSFMFNIDKTINYIERYLWSTSIISEPVTKFNMITGKYEDVSGSIGVRRDGAMQCALTTLKVLRKSLLLGSFAQVLDYSFCNKLNNEFILIKSDIMSIEGKLVTESMNVNERYSVQKELLVLYDKLSNFIKYSNKVVAEAKETNLFGGGNE